MWVRKANGEREKFQPEKIRRTCLRAGASLDLAEEVVKKVEKVSYNNISTRKILKLILRYLKREEPVTATRYSLKSAIMDLGPTGFAFEKLVKEIFRVYGYKAKLPEIIQGACVSHEVDVIAEKEDCLMIECKYHNQPGIYSGIKDVLYTYARFLDLKEGFQKGRNQFDFDKAVLVCNTRFSKEAKEYAQCRGIKLISWKYPHKESIRELLEKKSLYPITILGSINRKVKKKLAKNNLIFCRDLLKISHRQLQKITGLNKQSLEELSTEIKGLLRKN